METEYLEAILLWRGQPAPERVRAWLSGRRIEARPMRAGLLVSGSRAAFEEAFDVQLGRAEPPVDLPVPPPLREVVRSISLPSPRHIHPSRGGRS